LRAAFTLMDFGKSPFRYRRASENGAKTARRARAILRMPFTVR
jgi:hypothetical protein